MYIVAWEMRISRFPTYFLEESPAYSSAPAGSHDAKVGDVRELSSTPLFVQYNILAILVEELGRYIPEWIRQKGLRARCVHTHNTCY